MKKNICPKEKCTGCFTCYNICPHSAIKMTEDGHGYIYPEIDDSLCTECNACSTVCPALRDVILRSPLDCYAMYVKDSGEREKSTSGGAATLFSKFIIKNGGVVYGSTVRKGIYIEHIRVDTLDGLEALRGSKYVHSYITDSYKNAKSDLQKGLTVLFIGTPCQVAGLKSYLSRDYDSLYTIDLICHGVPSQKYLCDELCDERIDAISFRDKKYGFFLRARVSGNTVYEKELHDSPYYSMFMDGLTYRENCFECKYAGVQRVSDITVGDFWGLSQDSALYDTDNSGVSVLLPATKKGLWLLESCRNEAMLERRPIQEAIDGNDQLRHPVTKNKNYEKFKTIYTRRGLKKAYTKTNRKVILKQTLRKNKFIRTVYRLLKRRKS